MSSVNQLQITDFRNFGEVSITPCRGLNLIHGANGSGKTSLLEALHVLSTGKSFRSSLVEPLIRKGQKSATVFCATRDQNKVGLIKPRNQKHQLRLNEENQRNWDQVARLLPTQVLDATSFELLEGGPKARRRFVDWGVFHVEPGFLEHWRRASKCIANRNRLLKSGIPNSAELDAWDRELAGSARAIDEARAAYLAELLPVFRGIYQELVGNGEELRITYKRGWSEDRDLESLLAANREADLRYGSTQSGPHRADLDIKLGSHRALEILSRGQEKLLVCALKIAQGLVLTRELGRDCIYLVDDLPAELDPQNRQGVMRQLAAIGAQLFVTSVEANSIDLGELGLPEVAKFHVERGIISG